MDRHMRRSLAACGLGCVLVAAATGCRNLPSEVPPEPSRSHALRGEKADSPGVGFSSEPPPAQMNPFPNGAPGTGTVPGMQSGPMFSPNGPQGGRGQLKQPPADGLDQIPFQGNANPVRGEMGTGGAAPSPY